MSLLLGMTLLSVRKKLICGMLDGDRGSKQQTLSSDTHSICSQYCLVVGDTLWYTLGGKLAGDG